MVNPLLAGKRLRQPAKRRKSGSLRTADTKPPLFQPLLTLARGVNLRSNEKTAPAWGNAKAVFGGRMPVG
jgi:hypothetical protein